MARRIPEVDAAAPMRPSHAALDGDAALLQAELPGVELRGGNGKREVYRTAAIVGWYPPTRRVGAVACRATTKQQQHGRPASIHRDEPRAIIEHSEAKDIAIEGNRRLQIVDVQRGF